MTMTQANKNMNRKFITSEGAKLRIFNTQVGNMSPKNSLQIFKISTPEKLKEGKLRKKNRKHKKIKEYYMDKNEDR